MEESRYQGVLKRAQAGAMERRLACPEGGPSHGPALRGPALRHRLPTHLHVLEGHVEGVALGVDLVAPPAGNQLPHETVMRLLDFLKGPGAGRCDGGAALKV